MAGSLYILPPRRVHPVDVPFTVALKVFSKWGVGAGEFRPDHPSGEAIPGRGVGRLINPARNFHIGVGGSIEAGACCRDGVRSPDLGAYADLTNFPCRLDDVGQFSIFGGSTQCRRGWFAE